MKISKLKRGTAVLMASLVCTMPACSTLDRLEQDTAPLSTTASAPALPTEGALTTPSYYTPESAVPNDAYTPENQLKLLADRDFGGAYFVIVKEKGLENAIFPETDELVSVYADRRNRLVQEKYNVHLAERQLTAEEIIAELTDSSKTGVYFSDLLVVSPSLLKQLKALGLLVSLDSLPFFETDSVCISAEATAELNADWNGIYGIWGDVLRQPTRQLCVYYNIALADKLNSPNFYSAVTEGSWDFDALLSAAALTADEEGAGGILYDGSASELLLAASGVTSSSEAGKALLSDPAHTALIERMSALCLPASADRDAYTRFVSGESLFYIGTLGEMESFSQTENAVGVLPMPKYNAADETYPAVSDQSALPVLACPINVTTAEGTGIMLSALNAASCDEINDIFVQNAEQYMRDNGSTLMLPYLFGELHFDRKLIFGD